MFELPSETYLVLVDYPRQGIGSPDAVTSLDDAADTVAETQKWFGDDIPLRVLRIAHSLNCDDVTWQVLDLLDRRVAQRNAA